jgi:hypothetical protein
VVAGLKNGKTLVNRRGFRIFCKKTPKNPENSDITLALVGICR